MAASCCSLVSLYTLFLRRVFQSAGLKSKLIPIDEETTLHCWVPRSSGSNKPSLLLVHGFGPSPLFQWRYQVRPFSRFFDLYVPDLVFFGKSTTSSSQRSEVFQAECVAKMMDKLDVKRFSVVGTSYGGFVAYHMSKIICGERLEKVVIASSGVNRRRRHGSELMDRAKVGSVSDLMLPVTAATLRTLIGLSVFKPPRIMPDFLLEDIINILYKPNFEEKLQLLAGITLGKDDDVHISPLQQEVLIVWGEYDQIFPLENAYELKGLIGEKVSLEVMRKCSHVPQIEHPKRFNEIVKSFLLVPPAYTT
ncbi:hypothetical protein H6P81_002633 [Aristolochia fimbriata]|uniref:AB hydrolase-1 domain-containing protein n=1 Tax=Aristolochia fimbriata TaxID=158543 RepID=A0AAV7FD59_ARIFI|nr:hypothetical protein H6P81_002633 [Aristolochia fimbriata]